MSVRQLTNHTRRCWRCGEVPVADALLLPEPPLKLDARLDDNFYEKRRAVFVGRPV